MTARKPRISARDLNLSTEVILDSKGRRVDEAYIAQALDQVEQEITRRAGRPSLTGTSAHSPHVTFRITPDLKAQAEREARHRGITVSQLAREALESYLNAG